MSDKLTRRDSSKLEPVDVGERIDMSSKEVNEALKRLGGIKLSRQVISDLQAVGYTIRGLNGYRTLQGELLVTRGRVHHVLEELVKKCTKDGADIQEIIKSSPAIASLTGRITEAVRASTDILKAQNPTSGVDPSAIPPTTKSFPAGATIINGGNHVHAQQAPIKQVVELPLAKT